MEQRKLGDSGLTVSAMGLGCMGLSEFYGAPTDRDEAITLIHLALDLGINFLDTSDMYGRGHNEELLAEAIAGKRDQYIVATKFGILRGDDGAFMGVSGTPEYVRSSCEGSLRRLGIDTIDLYYQHRVDKNVPMEDTVGEMSRLVEEGKVRYLGLSECGPTNLRKAASVHPISALQTEYSLWSRDVEEEILPVCRELGIGFVPYSPLGRAFLAARATSPEDFSAEGDSRLERFPRFTGENFEDNLKLLGKFAQMAAEKMITPAQLALAWVLNRGGDMAPIPGTTRVKHLEDNVAAIHAELSGEDMTRLGEIFPVGIASGTRYSEAAMGMLDTD
jgi:aryl-alcohol dehydrogenase-like predicted oxidoreductase